MGTYIMNQPDSSKTVTDVILTCQKPYRSLVRGLCVWGQIYGLSIKTPRGPKASQSRTGGDHWIKTKPRRTRAKIRRTTTGAGRPMTPSCSPRDVEDHERRPDQPSCQCHGWMVWTRHIRRSPFPPDHQLTTTQCRGTPLRRREALPYGDAYDQPP